MRNGVFQGNLGKDWTSKEVSGTTVAENTLAVRSGKDGKETLWVKLSVWGKAAETVTAWAKKGDKFLCSGDVDVRAYADKEGQPRAELSCRVDKWDFLFEKKSDGAETGKPAAAELDDEIPF